MDTARACDSRRLWYSRGEAHLVGYALLRLPPPGLMVTQQGQHTKDAATDVPDAVVGAGTGVALTDNDLYWYTVL